MNNNTDFNNGYNYYGNENGNNNNSAYQDFTNGFESGNPVIRNARDLRSVLCQEVVAKSFLFMFAALLVTAYAAYTTASSLEVLYFVFSGSNFYILLFAELAIVLISNWAIRKNIPILAGVLFTAYSYLTGMTMASIFFLYTTASITAIFLVTAGLFAIMAVYGILTKNDLTSIGNILLMGLIGIILISLVNIFLLHSTTVELIISAVGVLVFVGLTAYDTQKIKNMVQYSTSNNVLSLALYGAFELYLDFINLFLKLIRLFGKRK